LNRITAGDIHQVVQTATGVAAIASVTGTVRGKIVTHRCFKIFDAYQKQKNTRLSFAIQVPSGRELLIIATEKVNSRVPGKAVRAMATFCPFCGMSVNDKDFASAKEVSK